MDLVEMKMENNFCIQEIWKIEQEILDTIHKICIEYKLRYSLAYGTLIGAIRHGGFIPWDDDIDLIMPREDYEKLLSIWHSVAPAGYILQNNRTDSDFSQNFTKIRKDHTTFIQFESEKEKKYHKGIFIDIFPGDRVAPGKISRKIQYIACAVNLLYSRGFTSGATGLIGIIEKLLLKTTSCKKYIKRSQQAERYIRRWNDRLDCDIFFPSTIKDCRVYYEHNLFDNMKIISFNGKKYQCVLHADRMLRKYYGDYMMLPPEDDRIWKHHPIVVDCSRNYEEILYR